MTRDSTRPGISRLSAGLSLLAIMVAVTIMNGRRPPYVLAIGFAPPAPIGESSSEPFFRTSVAASGGTGFVHSTTVASIGGGRIRACWLAGSSEGQTDVAIHTSVRDPATGTWSNGRAMITRDWVRQHLRRNIIALGNPLLMQHADGRLFLWFVSVSVGGWAGSALNMTVSLDGGETWQPPTRLITTPFFNVATLVRQPAFMFADGTIGLPVYHECMGVFAELLRLDSQGRVLHKQRLSWGRSTLQPEIVARNEMQATGLLRRFGNAPRQLHAMQTRDGGRTWTSPRALDLPNPGAPVAATRLESGELKVVFNNTHKGRRHLSLALSADDGDTWEFLRSIDGHGAPDSAQEVCYPALLRAENGDFHLLYTADLKHIRHAHFNAAWLEQQR